MTMNPKQVQKYVLRYLEATGCQVLEKSAGTVTVKLSPEADRSLTGRAYYWSFVERTGAEPETMTYTFLFDSSKAAPTKEEVVKSAAPAPSALGTPGVPNPQSDTILGRYFGISPVASVSRIPREEVTYGSRRLESIFEAAVLGGRFVSLFEEQKPGSKSGPSSPYSPWLGVNYKVEYICDRKKDELHSLGIHMGTGQIAENFHARLLDKKLTPRIPANSQLLRSSMSLNKAAGLLEHYLEKHLKQQDSKWAELAQQRLAEEVAIVDSYFKDMLKGCVEDEERERVTLHYEGRKNELHWQYRPRITATVINCGIFHLA